MVFKYGPVEPEHRLIKYGPLRPWPPQIVDKYAPIVPNKPGVKPEDSGDEEVKAILKQIADCLKRIKKLLDKTEVKLIAEELALCIAELNLLYLKLNDLQNSDGNKTMKFAPNKKGRDILIVYIVMTPAKKTEKDK